jgi:hypothetical protein
MSVSIKKLLEAMDTTSTLLDGDQIIFLDPTSGRFYKKNDLEQPRPDDLLSNPKYLIVPSKQDLDVGKNLVFEFTSLFLSQYIEVVHDYFRKKGAYARFIAFLNLHHQLENWYDYQHKKQQQALIAWCETHQIEYTT